MRLVHEKFLFGFLFIFGLLLGLAGYYADRESGRELVLAQIRNSLFQVAVAAEDKLQGRTFNELLSEGNLAYYPYDYQVAFLNKKLQPLAEPLAINGIGISYYDAERDSVIAYAPAAKMKDIILKPLPTDHPSRLALETKQPSFQLIDSSWRGPIYLLTVPLLKNGSPYGLLGISIPMETVQAQIDAFSLQQLKVFVIGAGVWLLLLCTVYYVRKLALQRYHGRSAEILDFDETIGRQLNESNPPAFLRPFLESSHIFQQMVKRLSDLSTSSIVILNHRWQILYMNRKLEEMIGHSAVELNNLPVDERRRLLLPKTDSDRFSALLQGCSEQEIQTESLLFTQRQGPIPVAMRAANIVGHKRTEGIIISLEDRRDFHRLCQLQTQTDLLLEALHEGVMIVHQDGTITYMNHAFEKILSTSRSEWVGKQIFDAGMEESVAEQLRLVLSGDSAGEQAMPQEFFNRRMSHLSLDMLHLKNPHCSISGALLIARDLTTEWQWNELSKRADLVDSLSQLAASMAHEVRNPLTSIRGFLQLLANGQPRPEKFRMYIEVMMEEIERAHGIISEYLNLARKSLTQQQPTSLLKLLDDIRILMESEAVIRGVNLHFYLTDVTILGEASRLKQVVINLIRNALEATARGGSVIVSNRVCEADRTVEILVSDTGVGMSAEELSRIFTPFFTTKKGGTGLGLPVCKQIIEEHGGTVQVRSQPGEGSCFIVRIPLPHTRDSDESAPLPHLDALA